MHHDDETLDDYLAGSIECPAIQSLDLAQAKQAAKDEKQMERDKDHTVRSRLRPDRARAWFTWRRSTD